MVLPLCWGLGGCGGGQETSATEGNAGAPPAAGGEQAVAGPTSQPQGRLRIGHYSTIQGTEGFVLDQTGPVPLVRIDERYDETFEIVFTLTDPQ
jgi:hypothetical protein